jgi:hypothetical protein
MKSEIQIKVLIDQMKDSLVNAEGDGIKTLQGSVRALEWVLLDEVKE